jgi:predicted nucleotidyltransferase component of viral defense system
MLNKQRHGIILKSILADIFRGEQLSAQLIFKGGTCLMMFYGLDRFSTDLDFDIRDGAEEIDANTLDSIIAKYITIDEKISRKKRFTYIWIGSYEAGAQKIKIEINQRARSNNFDIKNYLGITIPTMTKEDMMANKLAAILDRKTLQNRDLYDAHFMFIKLWEPNAEILESRVGMSIISYYKELIKVLDDKNCNKNILNGLGEVLEENQKVWVKNHLIDSLKTQLMIRIGE